MRMATLKSDARRDAFTEIPLPPDVIITRWGSWLEAVNYYCKYLPELKMIVNGFEDQAKIVSNVKGYGYILHHSILY